MTTSLPRPRPTSANAGATQTQARRRTNPTGPAGHHERQAPAAVVAVKRIFAAETGNYFVLLGATLFLVVFGLIMVLSSSSVESFLASGDFFNGFVRQVLFAALGIPLMLIASRMPARFWKRWAGTFLVIAIVLQMLVVATPLGVEHGGNKNWISLGPFSGQPSELVKLGLVAWLGYILSRKQSVLDDWRELAMPLVPVAASAHRSSSPRSCSAPCSSPESGCGTSRCPSCSSRSPAPSCRSRAHPERTASRRS
jgi:cell division protein FtsW